MKIITIGAGQDFDAAMHEAIVKRIVARDSTDARYAIHMLPRGSQAGRDFPEWLEWHVIYFCDDVGGYVRDQSMMVACIQRTAGAGYEFHS